MLDGGCVPMLIGGNGGAIHLKKRCVAVVCPWLVGGAFSLLVATVAQASSTAELAPPAHSQGKVSSCTLQTRSGCRILFVIRPPKIVLRTGSIALDGEELPLSVMAYLVKNALHRPWSSSPRKRHLMVCRIRHRLGSHIGATLHCETNGLHIRDYEHVQSDLSTAFRSESSGSTTCTGSWQAPTGMVKVPPKVAMCLMGEVATWANRYIRSSVLWNTLATVPAAGSSHTFQIHKHGHVVARYVFIKGRLAKVWHAP